MSDVMKGYGSHRNEFMALSSDRRTAFVIGTANYANLGDLAISEAQMQYVRRYFDGDVMEIQTTKFWEYELWLRRAMRPNDLILLQGGGNMGDLYYWFEFERCAIAECFPDQRIIMFPQTISYSSDDSELLAYAKQAYGRCSDLHLFAREHISAQKMAEEFPTTDVELVPDIVLTLDPTPFVPRHVSRCGLAMVLRNDEERSLSDEDWQMLFSAAEESGLPVTTADTVLPDQDVSIEGRTLLLSDILTTFASAQCVVTDRLHGMIFAAITETPCVVLSNSNHKIRGVYQWIKDLPYIAFIESAQEARAALRKVMNAPTTYPRDRILQQFEALRALL
ncbi:polysaccharide pyruvyl transferase family protein [Bifidobacterium gallicum]|uniref:Polysaccharide pyruvyl transferase n=2 Tax=Bifidobacterium gallicum DSM 20093 = LMG 11596 TaxID=561180 RepID=D1NRU5_9BIFI|nr:polysaccharide pyruvyl transferase family protein [Bifidobacterium gallicum]EFA23934.1 polysaccharide pyruvyl transferase [Bifidobacterium gallicum DSM 20093 = LMG 11596]